jgi:hypothetical protein
MTRVPKPKPLGYWYICEVCPTGSVLRDSDGQLVDCLCLVEKRRPS